jgi:hypothetical protein
VLRRNGAEVVAGEQDENASDAFAEVGAEIAQVAGEEMGGAGGDGSEKERRKRTADPSPRNKGSSG